MKKILVVVDMQNDFVDGVLGTKEAVGIVDNVVNKIKNYDGKIIATLDTHYHNYMETLEGKKLPVPHCIRMTNGWLFNEKVADALSKKDYKIVEKQTFGSTKLACEIETIKQIYWDIEIELCGLCSDICVISNALLLRANFPDITITVDASCCAGVTPEKHKAALEVMESNQIDVINRD
jgi:nicotinamidase-related amidase